MRLLYVIDSLAPGGAETSLAELTPGLIAGDIDLHILPLRSRLDLASRLERAGATIHPPRSHSGRIGSVRAVMEVARCLRPTLIHTTLFEADVAGRSAARLLGLPVSTSIVNDSYGPSHYAESNTARLHAARALDAATSRFATRFHAISKAIADSVPPRLGVARDKVDVIPRGRNPQELPFQPLGLRDLTRGALGIPQKAAVILAIGRLEPQKGLQHLLKALPAVAGENPDLVVLIAGKEGRSSRELRHAAADLELDVRFLGHRTDVSALLAAADVLCFPSEREGFGGVLIEAMAAGCPVVASSIPTTREILGTGKDCAVLVTPVGDPAAIGKALVAILRDPHAWDSRLFRGRSRFDHLYAINSVSERMVQFFQTAAETHHLKGMVG